MKRHPLQPKLFACLSLVGVILPVIPAGADMGQPVLRAAVIATAVTVGAQSATEPNDDAKPKMVPISFSNAPMNQIAKFLTDQLGKPVIVNPEVNKINITLVNPRPLPLDDAIYVLRTALHENGVAIEERKRTIHLIPIALMIQRQVEMVPANVDLATIEPSNMIVRKVFDIKHYDPAQLLEVLKPLMPGFGHITADPTTAKLIIVATAEQLITMSGVITELDKPDVSGRKLRVFPIVHCDVYEIVPMLEKLVSGYLGVEVKAATSAGGSSPSIPGAGGPGAMPNPGGPQPPPSGEKSTSTAGVITIKADKQPVLLIPDPRRSSIVVEAPPHVLAQITAWLVHLDQPKPPSTQTEIVEVQYGDAGELCAQLTTMLENIPDESLHNALRIFPFPASRRLMIVGSEQNRSIVKQWMEEIDVADTGLRITRTFTLFHADAQQITENIKELFQEQTQSRFFFYTSQRQGPDRTKVTVTANMRNNSVTVMASPERMARIAEQIREWDKPFTGEEAAPRIYHLKYTDPEKIKELFESLFTKKEESNLPWWFFDDEQRSTPSPVGRLFGQFRFEAYSELGKLIVVSKNQENYGVITRMLEQIDQPQLGGLPRIIQLKFADAETLAEQLNALLNAPGTRTSILRRGQLGTFKDRGEDRSPYSRGNQPVQRQPDSPEQTELSIMRFWWQERPPDIKVKQPSNLVGKLRIVPNVEQNLLMVAAPEEYVQAIEKLVGELDRPGLQVMIRAVIAEITHDDTTSLGFRFSSDPSVFTSGDPLLTENALRAMLSYQFEDSFGNPHTVALDLNVNNLLSLLRKVTNLRIKSEPKILTADNVEGEFFDGQDIPFISNTQTTDVGSLTQSFDYFPVGITLRVRPHITKEANVDLTVNLRISNIIPGRTLFGGVIVDRRETTTRIVLENGKTFMISGILREEERDITRRIPILGDIPLIGKLFTHREKAKVNTELLIFLTPYVIGPGYSRDAIESEPLKRLNDGQLSHPTEGTDAGTE